MAGLVTRGYCEVLEIQERISKKNKPYKLAVLGDKDTYFKGEFFLSDSADIQGLQLNTKTEVYLQHEVRGYDVSTVVVGFKQVK